MSESEYVSYANSIVLQIDEANRTITNDGTNTPIILGVRGDDCAERIYFESPKQLSPEIDLLEQSDVEDELKTVKVNVYVNYRNAVNEPYIQECSTPTQSVTSDMVRFSWIITNKATINKGDVKFNVCVKRTVYNKETKKWELTNEWHTTTFVGKVLDGIDVTKKTPEVITHDSVTLQQLDDQVNAYATAVSTYATEVSELHKTLDNVNEYVNDSVNDVVISEVAKGYVTNETYNNFTLETSAKFDNYLALTGGQMDGNIEFASGGIMAKSETNPSAIGGWTFDLRGYPTIVSDELKICASTGTDPFLIPLEYNLPAEGGTLARLEDFPKYHEHRIHVSINDMSYKVSGDVFFTLIAKEYPFEINSMDSLTNILKDVMESTSKSTSIMATGYIVTDKSTDTTMHNICSVHADDYPRLILNYINSKELAFKEFTVMHSGSTLNCIVTDTLKELNS